MAQTKTPRPAPQIRFVLAVIMVAVASALFALAFRALLSFVLKHAYGERDIVSAFRSLPSVARVVTPALGGLLAGLVTIVAARGGRSQGVGDVMEAVAIGRAKLSMRTTLLKSLGSWLAIGSGGSVGREGPLIQFGGSAGQVVARFFRIDDERARTLVAAGTAAGFAAAYNTPLAAVLFVLEVVTGIVALDAILPAIVATTVATVITRSVAGGGPIYGQRAFEIASLVELLGHAVLGLLAGLSALLFMWLLSASETWFARSKVPQPWRGALGGLCVGWLALRLPEVTGNGYETLNSLLDGSIGLDVMAFLFLAKAVATSASVSSGSPGGVFTPSLLLGAALGASFQHGLLLLFGSAVIGSAGGYALVGMAAMTAAMTHAPMMAVILVFELSGDYAIVLPLLLATTVATSLARSIRADSVYTAELRRRGVAWDITLEGRKIEAQRRSLRPQAPGPSHQMRSLGDSEDV